MTGGKGSKRGTPQGGVISPLLANIYMHRFLRGWRVQGKDRQYRARIISYADDFVILSCGHADEALVWTRWAMGQIGLTLNETKTCIRRARQESFDFLGYTFGIVRHWKDGRKYLAATPSKKSIRRIKQAIRDVLRPGNQAPWPEVQRQLNQTIRGWGNYFDYGTRLTAYRAVDRHVYQSVRHFLKRRHKVQTRGTRRFSIERVFGELGVAHLTKMPDGQPLRALV